MNRVNLGQKGHYALLKYMEDPERGFLASKLGDTEFAAKAAKDLDLPVNANHVKTARDTLGYEGYFRRASPRPDTEALTNLVEGLERRIQGLEDALHAQSPRLDDCIREIDGLAKEWRLHQLHREPQRDDGVTSLRKTGVKL